MILFFNSSMSKDSQKWSGRDLFIILRSPTTLSKSVPKMPLRCTFSPHKFGFFHHMFFKALQHVTVMTPFCLQREPLSASVMGRDTFLCHFSLIFFMLSHVWSGPFYFGSNFHHSPLIFFNLSHPTNITNIIRISP